MARRRNNGDLILNAGKLFVLLAAVVWVHPSTRERLALLGNAPVWIAGGMVALLILLAIIRHISRSQRINPPDKTTSLFVQSEISPKPLSEERQDDLATQLRALDWYQFEKAVEILYQQLGYKVIRTGGAKPDGGIDLIIEKDGKKTAIQCKQWKTWNVGVKPMREFLGALTDAGLQRGIFITLCGYTGEAKQLADKHHIQIIDETELTNLLEQSDARYNPALIAVLRDPHKYCPKCECVMVLRTAKKGAGSGKPFWGCSAYPRCRFTMPA